MQKRVLQPPTFKKESYLFYLSISIYDTFMFQKRGISIYIQVVVEAQHAFHHDSCFNAAVVIEVVVLTDVHTFKTCPWQSVVPPAQQAMCPSQIDERSNKDRFSGSRFQYTSILSLKKKIYGTGCSVESITIYIWATLGIIHGYEIN